MSIKSVLFQNVLLAVGIYCIYKYYSVRHFLFIDFDAKYRFDPIGGVDVSVIGIPVIKHIEPYNLTNVALIFLLLGYIFLLMSLGIIVRQSIKSRTFKKNTEA